MPPTQDWDIRSRSDRCAGSEAEFEDGQTVWSRLCLTGEGYIRQDYSEAAWEALDDKSGVSVWKSVFRKPPPVRDDSFRKENAETLLRKLIEDDDAQYRNTIYILALMLERKRLLVEQDVQVREDGVHIRIYEHKRSGESFLICDPQLKLAELERVQEEVVVMLGGKPRGEAAEPVPAPPSGAGQAGSEPTNASTEGEAVMPKRNEMDDEDESILDDEFAEPGSVRKPRRHRDDDDEEFSDDDDDFDEDEEEEYEDEYDDEEEE